VSTAAWTAVGTIALAIMTLAAVITTIVITAQDRRRSEAQIRNEHRNEQLGEAYLVRVLLGERETGKRDDVYDEPDGTARVLGAIVVNNGRYTITAIEARLELADGSLVGFLRPERVPGATDLDDRLRGGMTDLLEAFSSPDRLTPWDRGMRFESDPLDTAHAVGAYPVVRWTDRWGTRWEHRRGEVRQIDDGAPWTP